MVRRCLLFICCLLSGMLLHAQQTLNIHTTTKGVVSFAFSEQPSVTFGKPEVLTVTSTSMTVEFPFNEIERITFDDVPSAVQALTVREETGSVLIYDLSGKLMRKVVSEQGTATVDLSTLRPGVYIVKDGKRSYKVVKR